MQHAHFSFNSEVKITVRLSGSLQMSVKLSGNNRFLRNRSSIIKADGQNFEVKCGVWTTASVRPLKEAAPPRFSLLGFLNRAPPSLKCRVLMMTRMHTYLSSNTHMPAFISGLHQLLCQCFISISPPAAWVGESIRSYRSARRKKILFSVGEIIASGQIIIISLKYTCAEPQIGIHVHAHRLI